MRFVRPARFTACRGAKTNKRGRLRCVRSFRGKAQIHRVVSAEIAHGDPVSDASKSGRRDDVLSKRRIHARLPSESSIHYAFLRVLWTFGQWLSLSSVPRPRLG